MVSNPLPEAGRRLGRGFETTSEKRGIRPPKAGRAWTPEADALVRALRTAEVAELTGPSLQASAARTPSAKKSSS